MPYPNKHQWLAIWTGAIIAFLCIAQGFYAAGYLVNHVSGDDNYTLPPSKAKVPVVLNAVPLSRY